MEAIKEDNGILFELDEPLYESKYIEKNVSPCEEFNCHLLHSDGNGDKKIEALEKALKEEHVSRSALHLELEKERSVAATAADESMAMIIHLQEEKVSIEMEARKYRRMLEETAAYYDEEMNILKEILVRRDREKHFLEKEVEAFRHMVCGVEQSDATMYEPTEGKRASSSSSSPTSLLSISVGSGNQKYTFWQSLTPSPPGHFLSMEKQMSKDVYVSPKSSPPTSPLPTSVGPGNRKYSIEEISKDDYVSPISSSPLTSPLPISVGHGNQKYTIGEIWKDGYVSPISSPPPTSPLPISVGPGNRKYSFLKSPTPSPTFLPPRSSYTSTVNLPLLLDTWSTHACVNVTSSFSLDRALKTC